MDALWTECTEFVGLFERVRAVCRRCALPRTRDLISSDVFLTNCRTMTDDQAEFPLAGGRVAAKVVRVGDTVRKPVTANSDFVRRLLRHLTSKGFHGSPAFLGTDERERDILTFIDGNVPRELSYYDGPALRDAAELIREFHDLSSELVASHTTEAGIEIVCHNDLSPCNFVFRGNTPVAIIDFDASAPGSRAHDLGYAAWLWLDLGSPEISAVDQQQRLATFLEAYGELSIDPILEAMLERQTLLVEEGRRIGDGSMAEWANACNDWTRKNLQILRSA